MRCSKCVLLYTQWKDGELSARSGAELREHLAACDACRSLYARLDRIVDVSSSLPRFSAPGAVADKVIARIRSCETVPARFSRWLTPRLAYGALAMVVAAALTFAFFYQPGRRPGVLVAGADTKERIYSLGPAVESTELVVDEPDYSLNHAPSSEDVIYSLPSLPVAARPASF